jgi:hypothetical protein
LLPRPQCVEQEKPDRERHGDIHHANQDEPRPAPRRNFDAKKRIENREENQRHRQRLEQPNHQHPKLPQILIAQSRHDRPGFEDDSERETECHANQHPRVQRQMGKSSPTWLCFRWRQASLHRCPRILRRTVAIRP